MAHAYKIDLTDEEEDYLQSLTRQRTIQAQVVDRAKTLLYKAEGMSNGDIADRLISIISFANFQCAGHPAESLPALYFRLQKL